MGQQKKRSRGNLVRRVVKEYLISLAALVGLLLVMTYVLWLLCRMRIWYGTELLYPLISSIHDHLVSVVISTSLAGWLFITIIFAIRMWLYLREVVATAENMALHTEVPVCMSAPLKEIQDELNEVREMVVHNNRLAKEAEQRKNDLIVYLAHDLKTPLTSVIGYLTILKEEPELSAEFRARYTGIAYDKALRLEQLINEFFDITRFNLTTIELQKQTINLSRMLEQITSEFLPILSEKKLAFDLKIEPDISLCCDPNKLERVWDNLIRNAIFYCYENTQIMITLNVCPGNAVVTIENAGQTIGKEKLERIFEQFFRLDEARSSSTGGAGLGLAIAKEIVELHGGTILAESENEKICFQVILPLNE